MKPLTKCGKKRKGAVTCTEGRYALREQTWIPVKELLQQHLKESPTGEASRMAHTLGIDPAMIHYYSCPVCEHDTEPSFTIGMAILLYIGGHRCKRSAIPASTQNTERPDISDAVLDAIIAKAYNPFNSKPKHNYPFVTSQNHE